MPTAPTAAHALRSLLETGTLAGLDDAALLARCASGDPGRAHPAFAALIDRHAPMVLRACRAALADPHDADDAAQATFLVLARRAHKIRRADALACWLYGVARRVTDRARADRDRRRHHEARGAAMAAARRPDHAPPDPCPELFEELDRLPPRYKAPLILCHLEGRSVAEAAAALGCPPRTLQTRLTRGRARLRDRLARRGLAPSALLITLTLPDPAWADATARAAAAYTADRLAAGLATAGALSQARGALRTMLYLNLKLMTLAGLLAGAATLGVVAQRPAPPPTAAPVVTPAQDPPQGETFAVRVLDAQTGKPLPGARVRSSFDLKTHDTTADADGLAAVDLSRRRDKTNIGFDVWAEGYVQQRLFLSTTDPRHPKPTGQVEFRLHPGEETLGGTVLDEEGRPVAGATVAVWGYLGVKKHPQELAYRVEARTDAEGRWRSSCFRQMKFVALFLSHPDYLPDPERAGRYFGQPNEPVDPRALAKLRDFTDVQVLARGVEARGRVLDDRGRPVPGASVASIFAADLGTLDDLDWSTADADGRFRLAHLLPGPLILVARAPGRAPNTLAFNPKDGPAAPDVVLGPAQILEGRVVDTGGRPIAGARVNVDTWRQLRNLRVHFLTDADGRFRWDDAPADRVELNVDIDGRAPLRGMRVRAGDDLVFTLRKAVALRGSIRDATTNQVLKDARLYLAVVDPAVPELIWRNPDMLPVARGADYTLMGSSGTLYGMLDAEKPITYRVRVATRGYMPFISREIRADEVAAVVDARLTPMPGNAVSLSGIVFGPDGLPAGGATLVILDAEPVFSVIDGKIPDGPLAKNFTTAADGRFLIPGSMRPEVDRYALVVAHDRGFAEARLTGDAAEAITLKLRPWGRIEGIARIGDRPDAGREVSYMTDHNDPIGGPGLNALGETKADAEGRYAFDRVPPGENAVFRREGPGGRTGGYPIDVIPGGTTRVDLGGAGRPVIARVEMPEGFDPAADYAKFTECSFVSDRPEVPEPPAGTVDVDVWKGRWWSTAESKAYRRDYVERYSIKLGPGGTLRVDDLPAGVYRLKIEFSAEPIQGRDVDPSKVAKLDLPFAVPAIPGGRSAEPLDLGAVRPVVGKRR